MVPHVKFFVYVDDIAFVAHTESDRWLSSTGYMSCRSNSALASTTPI